MRRPLLLEEIRGMMPHLKEVMSRVSEADRVFVLAHLYSVIVVASGHDDTTIVRIFREAEVVSYKTLAEAVRLANALIQMDQFISAIIDSPATNAEMIKGVAERMPHFLQHGFNQLRELMANGTL